MQDGGAKDFMQPEPPAPNQVGLEGSLIPRNMKINSVNTQQLDAHIQDKVNKLV